MIREDYATWFCKDDISKIENYAAAIADKDNMWHCHHRLELTLDGEFALSKADLKRHNMYYHRPYFELIFLSQTEHKKLHGLRKARSDNQKRMISKAMHDKKLANKHWYNNGLISVQSSSCPPGFTLGRIYKRKESSK